jgi:hypothetical protein
VELSKHPSEWAEDELIASLSKPGCHLMVERRLLLPQFIGGAQAREMLLECVDAIRDRPAWLPEQARRTPSPDQLPVEAPVADDQALAAAETDAAESAATEVVDEG